MFNARIHKVTSCLLRWIMQPMVVVWGASDPWEDPKKARELFSGWSADFVELAGVGHFPMDEVPALLAAMLDAFIDECAVDVEANSISGVGRCSTSGPKEFSLRGLMAAAEIDAKVDVSL